MKYEQPEMEVIKLGRHNVVTDSLLGGTQTKPDEDKKNDDYDFGGL
jgi:hypothetical protein